jgi:hypothetical protein
MGKGGEDRPNAVTLMTLRLPRVFRLCQLAIISYTRWPFLNPHVGVFAGGALPGTLGIAEIDPNRSRAGETIWEGEVSEEDYSVASFRGQD